jgi:IS30 family transposase
VRTRNTQQVAAAVVDMLMPLDGLVRTIALDNNFEFAGHLAVSDGLEQRRKYTSPTPVSRGSAAPTRTEMAWQADSMGKKSCFSGITGRPLRRSTRPPNHRAQKGLHGGHPSRHCLHQQDDRALHLLLKSKAS